MHACLCSPQHPQLEHSFDFCFKWYIFVLSNCVCDPIDTFNTSYIFYHWYLGYVNDLSMIYLITMPLVLPIVGPSFDDGLDDVRQQWLTKGGLVWRHKGKGWLDRICPPIDIPTMQHNGYSEGRGAPCSSTGKWGVVGQVREWCPRFANVAIWQPAVPDPAQP